MNSPQRIGLTVRAWIREFTPLTYLLGTIIFVCLTAFVLFVDGDSDQDSGVIIAEYFSMNADSVIVLILNGIFFGAAIVSLEFLRDELKTEERGIRFLGLPLSNGERFAAVLTLMLFVIPLLTMVPIFVLYSLTYQLLPDQILLPLPWYLLSTFGYGWLIHFLITGLWLAPAFAFPKRTWWIVIGLAAIIFGYIYFTRTTTPHTVEFAHDFVALQDSTVVGLSNLDVLTDETVSTEAFYGIEDAFNPSTWSVILTYLFFYVAAYFALTHKKT